MPCDLASLHNDNLEDYPPIRALFAAADITARELDTLLTMFEQAMNYSETPHIMVDDLVDLHGDLVLMYADIVGPEHV